MATVPDWKLQLLARRRQEEAAARGREKAERERLSQMPAWKRGLLERRRAKLGLRPGEPGAAAGPAEAGPPDPGRSAVLREAIGPVHQNRFIRQERQRRDASPARPEPRAPRAGEAAGGVPAPPAGRSEPRKRGPDCAESREPSRAPPEAAECGPSSGGEGRDASEGRGRAAGGRAPSAAPEEGAGPPEAPTREAAGGAGAAREAEPSSGPAEGAPEAAGLPEGWKWTLHSGKVREWTPRDAETPAAPEPADKHAGPPGAGPGPEGAGARGRSPAPRSCGSGPGPLPPEDAGSAGAGQQEEEAAGPRPPPPAPPAPGDPLMSRLFYGVKAGPGLGAPRRSGHTFTVTPRRPAPPAAPAPPASAGAAAGAGKKRYPTAEEILVLGGYLRLSRSCLVKGAPEKHHRQLKISFSETALETTYQYPSESSVLEELGPEPETPSAPGASAAPPDDEEEEEEELQPEFQGGLRSKALIVDESCRR